MYWIHVRAALVTVWASSLAACSPDPSVPRALPYTAEPVRVLGREGYAEDLDGDGFDEVALLAIPSGRPPGVQAVWLQTYDGQTIEQANFEGDLLPPHFLDLDGDGVLEILAPYVRSDSLFVGFVDARGQKRGGFFLADGAPREEPDGVLPWDPIVKRFYVEDVNADGEVELVAVIVTRFARLPRGVFVYSMPEGRLLGEQLVGASLDSSVLDDFDADGAPELITSASSPNNGATAGGFDDAHSYVIVFGLRPAPDVRWSKETGGLWTGTGIAYADFERDERRELLVMTTTASSKPEEAEFEVVEPGTWRTLRHRTFAEPLRWTQPVDLDRDARPEVAVIRRPDELWAIDGNLEVVRRRRVADDLDDLKVWPDVDGDGVGEITVIAAAGALLIDPALRVKAVLPGAMAGIMRRGIGRSPYLLVEQAGRVHVMELTENRLWWFYRYGPLVLWGFGVIAVLGAAVGARTLYRRTRLLERVYPAAVDTAANGILVLDERGRVVQANATVCRWVGGEGALPRGEHAVEALAGAPALAEFLGRALAADPPRHHAAEVMLGDDSSAHVHYTTAEPVFQKAGGAPCWVVTLARGRRDAVYLDARLWAATAHEVTHKLKNALGTILLESEDLQAAYRTQAPEVAGMLDPYTERIVERVDTLRRETLRLMNVLSAENLTLIRSDLSSVIRDAHEALTRNCPSHVDLRLRLADGLPGVDLDRELIRTVLENLVVNASRAVGGRGTITVSTYSVPDLQPPYDTRGPTDYVVLEVRDNGTGIARDDLQRIFEPGFTTTEFGTGLGLALVRRIATHHGGFVEVESEVGVGSIFSVYLPVDGEPRVGESRAESDA